MHQALRIAYGTNETAWFNISGSASGAGVLPDSTARKGRRVSSEATVSYHHDTAASRHNGRALSVPSRVKGYLLAHRVAPLTVIHKGGHPSNFD